MLSWIKINLLDHLDTTQVEATKEKNTQLGLHQSLKKEKTLCLKEIVKEVKKMKHQKTTE